MRVVGIVYEDASWAGMFDDGGDDELKIEALAQRLNAVIVFFR